MGIFSGTGSVGGSGYTVGGGGEILFTRWSKNLGMQEQH